MPGTWIQTFTRRKFHPLDPRPEDIDILDIAHALARTCRFTGHVALSYTVGEHCCHAAMILGARGWPREIQLAALLHDAAEAYLCDISRPVKNDPRMAFYREAEARLEVMIYKKFWLPFESMPPEVKAVDDLLCGWEARDLLPGGPLDGWASAPEGTARIVPAGDPRVIELEYLKAFVALNGRL